MHLNNPLMIGFGISNKATFQAACEHASGAIIGSKFVTLLEEEKALPWNAVWDMFCLKNNVPVGEDFIAEIEKYEAEVTSKR